MFKTHLTLGMLTVFSSIALSLSAMSFSAAASGGSSTLDTALDVQNNTNSASATSQKRIDTSAENTLKLQFEIEQIEEEIKNLEVYRDHLTALVQSQDNEALSLRNQVNEIKTTRQGIVPLMYDMIAGLKEIIQKDAPIKIPTRQDRVNKLETMMARADVTDAEKFRRILEAYQIEIDYGTKLSTFHGQLNTENQVLEVSMLHLGRVSVVARSLDEAHYWTWNPSSSQWLALDIKNKPAIDQAFAVANQEITPSLLTLPISLKVAESTESNHEDK